MSPTAVLLYIQAVFPAWIVMRAELNPLSFPQIIYNLNPGISSNSVW